MKVIHGIEARVAADVAVYVRALADERIPVSREVAMRRCRAGEPGEPVWRVDMRRSFRSGARQLDTRRASRLI